MSYYWRNTDQASSSQVEGHLSGENKYIVDLVYFWLPINGWTATFLILAKSW